MRTPIVRGKLRPGILSRLTLGIILWLYRRQGWAITGHAPDSRKCVLLGFPHSTNWDFVFFLGAVHQLGITPSFMGKASLFQWPMTRFMHDMGGIPVDRSRKGDYVSAVAREFAVRDDLSLVMAPEGTRSGAEGWRSGFYHIAHQAGVPIVPAWVDHENKRGGIGPAIMPTGDYAADLAKIADFYRSVLPGNPRVDLIQKGTKP